MLNQSALKELKSVLIKKFPDIIDKMILFDSQSNGTARDYSDYDILLVVNKSYNWQFESEIYDICSDINLKYNILTDIKIISKNELRTIRGKQPFFQTAINTGISI